MILFALLLLNDVEMVFQIAVLTRITHIARTDFQLLLVVKAGKIQSLHRALSHI